MPKLEFISNAKPSLFAYPSPMKKQEKTVVEKVATAVLSTTAKTKARAKKNEKEKGGEPESMDTVSYYIYYFGLIILFNVNHLIIFIDTF